VAAQRCTQRSSFFTGNRNSEEALAFLQSFSGVFA
jgi:hypothetical protein